MNGNHIITFKTAWDIALNTEKNNMSVYSKKSGERARHQLPLPYFCGSKTPWWHKKTCSSQGTKVLKFNFVTLLESLIEHEPGLFPLILTSCNLCMMSDAAEQLSQLFKVTCIQGIFSRYNEIIQSIGCNKYKADSLQPSQESLLEILPERIHQNPPSFFFSFKLDYYWIFSYKIKTQWIS